MSSPVDVRDADRAPAGSLRLLQRPLWIVSGQLGVVLFVVLGFGVRGDFKPKLVILLLFAAMVGMIGFASAGRWKRIILSAPVVIFIGWWLLSYLWTWNTFGWWTDTQLVLPYVFAGVVLASMLPHAEFRAALVVACYLAIAVTVLELITSPGAAMVNPDGVPGWRGGFGHKNDMGPFMAFAILTLACFDRPSRRRLVAVLVAVALIIFSQSTTALSAGLVTLLVCVVLRRVAAADRPARATTMIGSVLFVMVCAVLSSTLFPALLGLRGKDATLSRRTEVWDGVWQAIEQRPWIGYGAGGVWRNPAVEPARSIMRDLGFTVFHAHNGYLEIMLALGVIGLGIYLWLVVSIARLSFTNLVADTPMAVFALGCIVMMLTISISEVIVFGVWLGVLSAAHTQLIRTDAVRRGRALAVADSSSTT